METQYGKYTEKSGHTDLDEEPQSTSAVIISLSGQGQAEAGRGTHGHRLCTGVRGAAPALRLPQQRGAWCPSPNSTGAGHGRVVITCVPELTDPDCTWSGISDSHADAGCVGGERPSSSDATAGAASVGGAVSVAA